MKSKDLTGMPWALEMRAVMAPVWASYLAKVRELDRAKWAELDRRVKSLDPKACALTIQHNPAPEVVERCTLTHKGRVVVVVDTTLRGNVMAVEVTRPRSAARRLLDRLAQRG